MKETSGVSLHPLFYVVYLIKLVLGAKASHMFMVKPIHLTQFT